MCMFFLFFSFISFLCALEQFKCIWDYLVFEVLIEFPCEILIVNSIVEFEGENFHYGKCKDFFKNFYVGLYVREHISINKKLTRNLSKTSPFCRDSNFAK